METAMTGIMRIEAECPQESTTGCQRNLSDYCAGVADGARHLRDGGAITKRRLIAINDAYSAGFRAGYFQRDG